LEDLFQRRSFLRRKRGVEKESCRPVSAKETARPIANQDDAAAANVFSVHVAALYVEGK
jgi:hypothetical protein